MDTSGSPGFGLMANHWELRFNSPTIAFHEWWFLIGWGMNIPIQFLPPVLLSPVKKRGLILINADGQSVKQNVCGDGKRGGSNAARLESLKQKLPSCEVWASPAINMNHAASSILAVGGCQL